MKKCARIAGSAAEIREDIKSKHYEDLTNYNFVPVAVETLGAWGSKGRKLIKEIGRKVCEVTGEKRSTFYLFQSISVAVQRGNAACIIGSAPKSEGMEEVFEFVEHSTEAKDECEAEF